MVLLDEPPHQLLSQVTSNFQIHSDTSSLSRISSSLSSLRASRQATQAASRHSLRLLSRTVDLARNAHADAAADAAARQHGDRMVALDRTKFALAKSVNELESGTHTLDGELAELKHALERLDAEDVAAREAERAVENGDGTLLKLRVFRSLGIELVEDGKGGWGKAVIRNGNKGDVHVVAIEDKFSPFFYANYFWGAM